MKKQSLRKLLAMLLCLSMALSLLPAGALATGQGEGSLGVPPTTSSEVSEEVKDTEDKEEVEDEKKEDIVTDNSGESEDDALTGTTEDNILTGELEDDALEIDQRFAEVPGDGVTTDTWEQDTDTVKGTGAICAIADGKLHLKAGSENSNGKVPADWPAAFENKTASAALKTVGAVNVHFVELEITPVSTKANTRFGVFINYTSPGAAFMVGYDTGGWFWETYKNNAGVDYYKGSRVAAPEAGTTVKLRLEWAGTSLTKATVDGTNLFPDAVDFAAADNTNDGAIAIKLATYNGNASEVYIKNLHYTGQAVTTVYDVSGTVTEADGGAALEGATVTIGGKTDTTNASGAYTITGLAAGTYTGTVTKAGYKPGTIASFDITDADITGKDTALVEIKTHAVTGTVKNAADAPIEGALVTAGGESAVTDAEGAYTLTLAVDETYDLVVNKGGYKEYTGKLTVAADGEATGADVVLAARDDIAIISTDAMDVIVSKNFPQVLQYTMKGDLEGKIMYGQTEPLDTIQIMTLNDRKQSINVEVTPTVKEFAVEGGTASYVLTVKDEEKNIDADIYAQLVAVGNILTFQITRIDSREERLTYPVQSVYIPNHSLVSVRGTEAGDGNLMAARLANNTITSGDTYTTVDQADAVDGERYLYAFVSGNGLTAGISGNSQIGTSAAGSDNNRITVSGGTLADETTKTIGLGSSLWYYDRYLADSFSNARQLEVIPAALRVVGPSGEEMPFYAKVVITGDENSDNVVDWQDSAIAARDQDIIHKPYKGAEVRDVIGTRIAMNFGSHAQNPFLTTLDNVKRVALNTDGLGQSILLKGYANEGHDSGHPDFWDIGTRMGGVKDFNAMMEEGRDYGALFGIHVNTSEFYPEAKAFSEDALFWKEDGSKKYGWEWIDQGIAMNGIYDLAMGYRRDRFDELKALVGDNLNFIYVDVWGNNTSGSEDAWQTRKLTMDMTENDWRVVHEWSYANEWDSTFQHWVSDYGYGDYGHKGKYNSDVLRFMLNGYKDTWAPDFAHMGGNANAPLLGGPVMQGFEGWQGDGEYDMAMEAVFEHLIPTKFLQHFDIMKWVDNDDPVDQFWFTSSGSKAEESKWGDGSKVGNVTLNSNNYYQWNSSKNAYATDDYGNAILTGGTTTWTPEVQIELQADYGGKTHEVVITRGSDATVNDYYKTNAKDITATRDEQYEYRARHITLDGKVILKGAAVPAAGDTSDVVAMSAYADQQYLIPWLWDTEGKLLADDDQKLYHRNDVGGASTWELPEGWENLTTVKMYELTDNGRINETIVGVENGSVTLDADAKVPYVIVKGENGAAAPTVEWSTGMHLTDVSFNGADLMDSWNIEGSGEAVRFATARQIPMLKLTGEVSVNQKMTDLIPGQQYAVYVGVDNRSDSKAYISVTANGREVAYNYAGKSIAKNYVSAYAHHNGMTVESGSSYFQNMQIFFTAPSSGEVVLTLGREAGAGNTYFDDVRVVENSAKNGVYDSSFNLVSFNQDFEDVAAGLYPFVVSGIENVADNRQHLSERNGVYTQAGWDNGIKRLDDVIDGTWSLKVNGKAGANTLTFQTLPQTVRFAPGVTYEVSFDYEMGTLGAYSLVYGVGEYIKGSGLSGLNKVELLSAKDGKVGNCTFTITGDPSGQSWFGIYSDSAYTANAPKNSDLNNFVLDNLSIKRSGVDKSKLVELIAQADSMSKGDYTGDWTAMQTALRLAKLLLDDPSAVQSEIDARATALESAINALVKNNSIITGVVTLDSKPVEGAKVKLMTDSFANAGSAVTGADGKYTFENLSGGEYYVIASATGCDVRATAATVIVNGTATNDIVLTAHVPAPYEVTFENGDVSMMQPLAQGDTVAASVAELNGSKALSVKFTGTVREKNFLVDKSFTMTDGVLELDVTPKTTNDVRFGIILRATDSNNRICIGQFDGTNWGYNHWNGGKEVWSSNYNGPSMKAGETRHLTITLNGNAASLRVDGILIFEVDDISVGNTTSAPVSAPGYIGFNHRGLANSEFIVDNMGFTPSAASEGNVVTGKVLSDTQGVFGAQVTIKDGSAAVVVRTTTDLEGGYTAKLTDGTYTIEVAAAGYSAGSGSVTVNGATVTVDTISLTVDKTQLKNLYDANKNKENEDYTEESWKTFTDALTAAKAALDNESAGQATISKAFNDLSNALNGLVGKPPVPVNKALLRTYYNSFNSYIKSDYKETGWDAFVAALQAASVVLKSTEATQSQVDAAKDALIAAEKALEKISQGGGSTGGGSSTTTTETTKNPDGSTTTTVTNKTTGTVTETTTGADGTKVVTETKKDGTSTTVVTLPKNPDGPVTLPGKPASAGDTITVKTDKPADVVIPVENVKPGIVPVIVKADGTEVIVKKSVTDKNGVALSLDGSAVIKLKDNSKTFGDLSATHWAADAVQFAASRELFQGTGGDSFSPVGDMTRSMLITVLARLDGQDTTGGETWYSKAVDWGKESGITDGTNIDASITRESLVVMLYRYAKAEPADGMALNEFSDADDVSAWAAEAMRWAVANGILNGSGGKLNPTATASRAEVATMLMRFVSM